MSHTSHTSETQEELTDRRIIAMIVRGCDLFDVFSPERIGKACARHKLIPGPALDLRTGYDLSTEADRRRAFKLYAELQPELVMLSPPCTEFSRLQGLNRHVHGEEYRERHDRAVQEATRHVELCISSRACKCEGTKPMVRLRAPRICRHVAATLHEEVTRDAGSRLAHS